MIKPFEPRFLNNDHAVVSVGCICGCGSSANITWQGLRAHGGVIDFERDGVYAALRQAHYEHYGRQLAAKQRHALLSSEHRESTVQFRINPEITCEKNGTTWRLLTAFGEFRYEESSLIGCLLERMAADAVALRAAVDPVRSWYDGDGQIEPPPTDVDIARQAIVDLQSDRDEVLTLEAERRKLLDWTVVLDIVAERLAALRDGLPSEVHDADAAARLDCIRALFAEMARPPAPETLEPS